jgi:hypothetical protein
MAASTTENPLAPPSAERIERQRVRAYHLWEQDGCPHGRADEYWERAGDLLAMEDNPTAGQLAPDAPERPDEAALQDNLGEFPDRLSDQGEHRATPMTRAAAHGAELADSEAQA